MTGLLSELDDETVMALSGMLVGVIAILGGVTLAITKVVSSHYRRTQRDEMEATLKMEMVQRGMSADEIARVLEARMGGDAGQLMAKAFSGFSARRFARFGKTCGKV